MKVKAIIFDWGGVLCECDNLNTAEILSEKFGINSSKILNDLSEVELRYSETQNCIGYYSELTKRLNIPRAELQKAMNKSELTEVYELAKKISRKYPTYILSNNWKDRTDFILGNYDLTFFTNIFFSDRIGIVKPKKEAYMLVLNEIEHPECMFIDDHKANTDGAEIVGIKGILFQDVEILQKDLRAQGVTW